MIALLALWRLDWLDGRRMHRPIPTRWRTLTAVDGGRRRVPGLVRDRANSSDDGYILQMARTADHAGYTWPTTSVVRQSRGSVRLVLQPAGTHDHVSDASIWIRLPDLVCALVCWLLLSREVLPRLGSGRIGQQARAVGGRPRPARRGCRSTTYLRPEGQIATGALLITYVLIERAVTSLTSVALAITTAAFTLGIQPTGLIAVAALLAGGRPILRIVMRRRRMVGNLAAGGAAVSRGTVILAVVFADQTLATVLEVNRICTKRSGPARNGGPRTCGTTDPAHDRRRDFAARMLLCSPRCACSRRCS